MDVDFDLISFVLGVLAGVAISGGLLLGAFLVIRWVSNQGHSS